MSSQRYLQFQSTGIILALFLSIFVISLSVFLYFYSATTEKLIPSSLNIFTYLLNSPEYNRFPDANTFSIEDGICTLLALWHMDILLILLWIWHPTLDCTHIWRLSSFHYLWNPLPGHPSSGIPSSLCSSFGNTPWAVSQQGLSLQLSWPLIGLPRSLLILLMLQHFLQDSCSSTAPMLMLTLLNPT